MTAMDELHEAKAELRAALLRGVRGTLADERADELIDRYQTALKGAHRERVLHEAAAKQRARAHEVAERDDPQFPEGGPSRFQRAEGWYAAADLIDPEVTA